MAKKAPSRKKPAGRRTARRSGGPGRSSAAGKQLVIVESPAKAKTINRYLGPSYIVQASVGHVRDLPRKAARGSKQPVPGVDLENNFEPTYEVLAAKKKTLTALKKTAREASEVWFATDLDREGEAIAWHLAQELGIDPAKAKRVIFNAITKSQIEHAFANPHPIDMYKVNAQQARRILDRIVGYQVSPLLWKKVARGLSAGRVQSVALRLVVEREREIRRFVPSEFWRVTARLAFDVEGAPGLIGNWSEFVQSNTDQGGKGPSIKAQNAWLSSNNSIRTELVEVGGEKFDLGCGPDEVLDLSTDIQRVAEAVGLENVSVTSSPNPGGKGPATTVRTVEATIDPRARYRVASIQTKRTTTRPSPPFITSTLQQAAASQLGFRTQQTMRVAQSLYEGVQIPREGQVGLITYMRTDSTHLSGEALGQAREYIGRRFGAEYLPEKPNFFGRSKEAQEAHEAIRPSDIRRHPDDLAGALNEQQLKLYRLIWNRFAACQMTAAQWDTTTALLHRSDEPTGSVLKTTGRVLVFDGFYRVTGVPGDGDEQLLPALSEQQELAPFSIDPEQVFTNPPPRYSEASLVKALEADGIGRPSTYASIIQVIQDRQYVEQIQRRFWATDLGEVVIDKLIEGFPRLMEISYTREMEEQLDRIEEQHTDWISMLDAFYGPFAEALATAHETLQHAKAETQPAPYKCPSCGSRTCYRFGKNGRFLSCGSYPDCDYAAPINREGHPMLPEKVDVACPEDHSQMMLRTGRFGRFLASVNYPDVKYIVNIDPKGMIKLPVPPPFLTELPCPKCESRMNLRRGKRGPWLGCSTFPKCRGRSGWAKFDEALRARLEAQLEEHEQQNQPDVLTMMDGTPIAPDTPVDALLVAAGEQKLDLYDDDVPCAKSA